MKEGFMQREKSGSRLLIMGALLGSAAMYFLDPDQGRRRRALLNDKFTKWSHELNWYSQKWVRHLANKTKGLQAELKSSSPSDEAIDDKTLESRVRSEFGRKTSHARSIAVEARSGVVTLSGPILEDEVRSILKCVRGVKGVRDVINRLKPQRTPEHVPGLQGEGKPYLQ